MRLRLCEQAQTDNILYQKIHKSTESIFATVLFYLYKYIQSIILYIKNMETYLKTKISRYYM